MLATSLAYKDSAGWISKILINIVGYFIFSHERNQAIVSSSTSERLKGGGVTFPFWRYLVTNLQYFLFSLGRARHLPAKQL